MQSFLKIVEAVESVDVHAEWANSIHMCDVTYKIVDSAHLAILHGNDKSGARRKRGVYRHVDTNGKVWYVGKAVEGKSNIGHRQSSHFGNFRGTNYNESSGASYRDMMKQANIDTLQLKIEYVDMSHLPAYTIDIFEKKTIEVFKPCCNKQSM
jgi:hypothetical protein